MRVILLSLYELLVLNGLLQHLLLTMAYNCQEYVAPANFRNLVAVILDYTKPEQTKLDEVCHGVVWVHTCSTVPRKREGLCDLIPLRMAK